MTATLTCPAKAFMRGGSFHPVKKPVPDTPRGSEIRGSRINVSLSAIAARHTGTVAVHFGEIR